MLHAAGGTREPVRQVMRHEPPIRWAIVSGLALGLLTNCPRRTPSWITPWRGCEQTASESLRLRPASLPTQCGARVSPARPLRFRRTAPRLLSPARARARLVRARFKVAGAIPECADASPTPESPSRHLDAASRSVVGRMPATTACKWPWATPSSTRRTPLRTGPPSSSAAPLSSSGGRRHQLHCRVSQRRCSHRIDR